MNSKLTYAVAALLGGASMQALAAEQAAATSEAGAGSLEEIIVTAQRRNESMQDVPISMQAFTEQTLQQLNVTTFDDYIKYLPNVTSANNGPGQNEVYMRGLSAGTQASQGSGSTGVYPNVAIYLDNQSGQLPGRNLDIYAVDLNRIEVLEGPQGTLFGSGAEAGAVRYITNEPKLDKFEARFKAGLGVTQHGDPNNEFSAVFNFPLLDRKLALRAVLFRDHRGGYIDNVPATFTRQNSDVGIWYAGYAADANGHCPDGKPPNTTIGAPYCVPPGSPVLSNAGQTGKAINPVTYRGGRVEGLWQINDDWNVLISDMYQELKTQGVFYQQPNASDGAALAPLEVTLFNPAFDTDHFNSLSWTLNGKLGPLKAVYTGGILDRQVEQMGDYTNYARGVYAGYYQCVGYVDPGANPTPTCYSPSSTWYSSEQNKHTQHEIRVSSPDEWRLRFIAGAYYQDNKLNDQTGWQYRNVPSCTNLLKTGCFADVGTFPGTTVRHPGLHPGPISFYQDQVRETKQTALFASVDVDLIPKQLTLTLGTRHFNFDNSSAGAVMSSFGCFEVAATPAGCQSAYSYNLNAQNLKDSESGFKSRANLTWHVTPDAMLYLTWSQGFRPGGFNQNGKSAHAYGSKVNPATGIAYYQYLIPREYQSDKLLNQEIGWKTEFLDHKLQWNGAIYRESWDNVQIAFFNPNLLGNLFFDTNGQNFLIKGFETSLVARVSDQLTLQAAASWNQSEQTNSPVLVNNNDGSSLNGDAASPDVGQVITQYCNSVGQNCQPAGTPFGPKGSPSANAPPLQYSLRGRYEWKAGGWNAFAQAGVSYTGHSFTQAGQNPTYAAAGQTTSRVRFELESYDTWSASVGAAKGPWDVELYGENLSNSNASTFTSTDQFIVEQTPLRPRVIGLNVGYKL